MIRHEVGTAAVELEALAADRTMAGELRVHYAPDDLLMAVVGVLLALEDDRAAQVDALLRKAGQ